MKKTLILKTVFLVFLLVEFYNSNLYAQGVNIGSNTPADSSATLEVSDTTGGFLLPRLTTVQRNAIQNPANGLQIYNTTTNCVQIYMPQSGWRDFICDCPNPPSAAFTFPDTAGKNQPVIIAASTPGMAYSWGFQSGTPSTSSQQTDTVTWSSTGTYMISLTVTNNNGCSSTTTDSITIINCPTPPSSAFTFSDTAYLNQNAIFSATTPGMTYSWAFQSGTPSTSSQQTDTVTWSSTGTYTISLTVTNNYGCYTTTTDSIYIDSCSMVVGNNTITFNYTGSIQSWTVPQGVCLVRIEARGAQGGAGGGQGARMIGTFQVTPGEVINILVGQQGQSAPNNVGNGGGGGTFVVKSNNNTPMLIAGGGGGTAHNQSNGNYVNIDGTTSTNGLPGQFSGAGQGGSNGNGGQESYTATTGIPNGGGGGGFYTDGGSAGAANGGKAYINGGAGGSSTGGFGGGGGSNVFIYGCGSSPHGGSGGGGYSGGGAGGDNCNGAGGGGGSYNTGTNQANTSGYQSGNGLVIITY